MGKLTNREKIVHKSRGNKNIVEGKGSDGCGKNGSATTEDGHGVTIGHRDR
jgi:hypothetical protein